MMDHSPDSLDANHLPNGLVKFPPNVHGIYVEPQDSGYVRIVAKQNDTVLSFVLSRADCAHLASLLSLSPALSGPARSVTS